MKLNQMQSTWATRSDRTVTLLPDPERRPRKFLVISVDDHLVEPPDAYEGRLPARFANRAPKLVTRADGTDAWTFEDKVYPNIGVSAVVGRPIEECAYEPEHFSDMRRGAYDPEARVHDMDLDGVYASVCFPSGIVGFGGQRLQLGTKDPELALAMVRAVNDWHLESWVGEHRDRFIPTQIPYLLDPVIGAAEIRANAERGFKAVTFPEAPHKLGFPSLHTGHWDPLIEACAETGTVVCLHIGSASDAPATAPDAPMDTVGVLFFGYAMFTAVDWLYSLLPVRFPDLKIAMSEGGIAWVPGLIDRLNHVRRYQHIYGTWTRDLELSPTEAFHRNFWHCVLDDPANMRVADVIGYDRVMIETDYPHLDSCWPETQSTFDRQLVGLPDDAVRKITWQNASELFRHPVPPEIAANPELF
jgi:predicted TIM-barrel fold metal-dependent hydrolase